MTEAGGNPGTTHEPSARPSAQRTNLWEPAAERQLLRRAIADPAIVFSATALGLRGFHLSAAHSLVWTLLGGRAVKRDAEIAAMASALFQAEPSFIAIGGLHYLAALSDLMIDEEPLHLLVNRIWLAALGRDAACAAMIAPDGTVMREPGAAAAGMDGHCDFAAEQRLIGCALLDRRAVSIAAEVGCKGFHLTAPRHAILWTMLGTLVVDMDQGAAAQLVAAMRAEPSFKAMEGTPYLHALGWAAIDDMMTAGVASDLADRVRTSALRRDQWIAASSWQPAGSA